jgi:hypothetical protein
MTALEDNTLPLNLRVDASNAALSYAASLTQGLIDAGELGKKMARNELLDVEFTIGMDEIKRDCAASLHRLQDACNVLAAVAKARKLTKEST